MSISFLGAKNAGSVRNSQNTVNNPTNPVAMTWNALYTAGDVAQQLGVPGQAGGGLFRFTRTSGAWYKYTFDPQADQGAFNFGVGKSLQVNVVRARSYNAGADSFYFVGRVIVYVPSTGQTFVLGPQNQDGIAWPSIGAPPFTASVALLENSNDVLPIVLSVSSQVEIWMESDTTYTGGAITLEVPSSNVIATLFNFELPPVSVS